MLPDAGEPRAVALPLNGEWPPADKVNVQLSYPHAADMLTAVATKTFRLCRRRYMRHNRCRQNMLLFYYI